MANENHSRITLEDVAREAGVSAMTVSRVINKSGAVSTQTAERVFEAIADLNYIPHRGARVLAGRKTHTLGLLFPEIGGVFFSELIRGIEAVVNENGYALLIYSTQGRPKEQSSLDMPLGDHNTDGLIIFTDSLADSLLLRLYANGFPMVLLHRSAPEGVQIPCVTFENKKGARQMVSYLIGCGYERIVFLAGDPDNEDAYWREMGYREALAEAGIAFDPALIGRGAFDDQVAEESVLTLLQAGAIPDAIFAADDESARGAMRALRHFGLRIPEDVAVAGFDDALLSQYLNPPLTTVRAPIEEAGRVAAQQLLNLIHTGQAEDLILLPTELVIRESCAVRPAKMAA